MNIPPTIADAINSYSSTNMDFLQFVEKNPELLERQNFPEIEAMTNRLYIFQSWPIFLSAKTDQTFGEVGNSVFDLIKSIPGRLFQNDNRKIAAYYEMPASFVEMQMDGVGQHHYDQLIARGDFCDTPTGLKCLEYNISPKLGGIVYPIWQAEILKNSHIQRFLQQYHVIIKNINILEDILHHLMKIAETLISPVEKKLNVGYLLSQPPEKIYELEEMSRFLHHLFPEVTQKHYAHLHCQLFSDIPMTFNVVNDCLYYKGERIHALVLNIDAFNIPPSFMNAFRAGNVAFVNAPFSLLLSNKSNLALLSQHADSNSELFTPAERETITKHIPWTRKLVPGETTYQGKTIRLEEFVFTHKDKLVVKAGLGFGGKQVFLGKNTPIEEWKHVLQNAAIQKKWVIQELLESSSIMGQYGESGTALYDTAWGIFIVGHSYDGVFLRILPQKDNPRIINAHQGAQTMIPLHA